MKLGAFTLFFIIVAIGCLPVCAHAESVEVLVTGVTGEALDNVTAALLLPGNLDRKDQPIDRRWLEHFRRRIPDKVARALEPFGYFATITSVRLENHKKNSLRLMVEVTPGEPVRVTSIHVAVDGPGGQEKSLRKLVTAFPLTVGDILRQDIYEEGKGELQATALDLGFLQADFSVHEIRVDRGRNSAEIELLLTTGLRYRFGTTLFHGAPGYPEAFLRRHLVFAEGEFFSHHKLGQSQLNFLDSDRFREVIITPLPELAEHEKVPVSIQLTPTAQRRLRPGIGYGTDTGGRFSLQYKDVNLFHRAHLFKTDLLLAERRQSLVADYVIPSSRNLESQVNIRLGFEAEDVETYETRSLFTEVEQIWGLGKGWMGSMFFRLQQEDYIVGQEDNRSRMIIPGLRLSRRRYADPVRPRKGYAFRFETRGAHQALGSDISLLQFLFSGNHLTQLPGRLSLFVRAEAGATLQNEPFREIPASLRFFAGGDQSVRGYRYQSLGPKDDLGETIGGKYLAVGSLELERALWDRWGVACFYDAGNAFNDLTTLEWAQGTGIGVRYYSQVGAIKVDIARQIGEPDPSWRLHFSIGFGW